jgi:hypothetical protein
VEIDVVFTRNKIKSQKKAAEPGTPIKVVRGLAASF